MRKKMFVVALSALMVMGVQAKVNDPVVMTIDGRDVTRSEFEYFYTKNNQQDLTEDKTFDEYVDLFVNYKLKVAEALHQGVDTTRSYISELAGYRKQLADPYLIGRDWQDTLVNEFLARRGWEVHAAHILVMAAENASVKDEQSARKRLAEYKEKLAQGAPFDSLARAVSEDPSARQNAGDLGYFAPGQMVYSFESAAFNAPIGEVVECRSQFGYHLIKVYDRRKSKGEVRVAHIMKSLPRTMTPAASLQVKADIDSIYAQLQAGKSFAELAQRFSDDQHTAPNGGEYPWLNSAARFPKEWLDAAFALADTGSYTAPFATSFGWHIIKLIEKRTEAPETPELREQLKQQLQRDPERQARGKEIMLARWAEEHNMTINEKHTKTMHKMLQDTAITRDQFVEKVSALKKPLLTIGKTTYPASDFANYIGKKFVVVNLLDLDKELTIWSNETLYNYVDEHLGDFYPEFKHLYQEYHDGILLFEVSSEAVWNKAASDSVGLQAFFEANRPKFAWPRARFKGAVVECANDSALAASLHHIYKNNDYKTAAELVKTTILNDTVLTPDPRKPRYRIINGIFDVGANSAVDVLEFNIVNKTILYTEGRPVVRTYGRMLKAPESLEDVRGQVVAEYQTALEKQWVEELRSKYTWKLNQKELNKIKEAQKK